MDKFLKVLTVLSDATQRGKVVWEVTPDEDVFRAWVAGGMVKIGKQVEDGQKRYWATLSNPMDELVDELEIRDGPNLELIEGLFSHARRSAMRGDQLLDQILRELSVSQ